MVLKRPKLDDAAPKPDAKSDVELMEHLVKKSLQINPELRDGKGTHEVMDSLRQQAIAQSRSRAAPPPAAPSGPDKSALADRRKSTIAFFFEQKAKEVEEAQKDLAVREAALKKERQELQQRVSGELADFLGMMSGAVESPETREVLKDFKSFLSQLGVAPEELLQRAKRK
jgi:hypothetical protein